MRAVALLFLAGFTILLGCRKETRVNPAQDGPPPEAALPQKAQPRLQTIRLYIGIEELVAELALTPEQRMTGMMFRDRMGENEAMLFVFPEPHKTAFWMKNTPTPLSAAYIDPKGAILEIHDLHPHNTNSVQATSDQVQYVLETSQGWFQRHNVSTGAFVVTERGPLDKVFTFSQSPRGR